MGREFYPSDALSFFKELIEIMDKELQNPNIQPQVLASKKKRLGQFKRIYKAIEPNPFFDRLYFAGKIMADQLRKDPTIESFIIKFELKSNPDGSKQSYIDMEFLC